MLQRIQTAYLLIISVLMTCMALLPLASFGTSGTDDVYIELGLFGLSRNGNLFEPLWGLFVLTVVIVIIDIVAVFMYKKRVRQIRLCVYNAILMICFYGIFAYTAHISKQAVPEMNFGVKPALSFPLISLILDYLAIRNIGADEVLVRSVDRLR
jgi:hypothetical protein